MKHASTFEPYAISVVRPLPITTREQREDALKKSHYNLFGLASQMVTFDLLTDSGTGAISNDQLGAIMTGDESYAGSKSFAAMKKSIHDIMGFDHVIPTHQGRAAENVLCSALVKEGDLIPGNAHFDTTKGHIEYRRAKPIDCTIAEGKNPNSEHPFKGNLDLNLLEDVLKNNDAQKIPFVIVTITCNTGGGQPVSLSNIKDVKALCKKYGIKLILDIARFAENAYFIKEREAQYKDWSIRQICHEIFLDVDGVTMSAKKDAIVAMGGFLALRDQDLFDQCKVYSILFEGYLTYGGMTGGTMAALAQGLQEVTDENYLQHRIHQVREFGNALIKNEIPLVRPIGGHAVFVDALQLLPHIPRENYPAQSLGVAAYLEGGIRGVEVGTVLADRDPLTRENRYPAMELLRLAIPRRTFTKDHLQHIADVFTVIKEKNASIKGLRITKEPPILRHFSCEFEVVS